MSVPVPLGVRIFNTWGHAVDAWVTDLVDDISFRSVVPGGYANATITLHNDQPNGWTQIAQSLNRVQVVDLRSQEIAWEGRIDSIRRRTDTDTWELGCLGSMAYASDIQRPMFYIDSDLNSWTPAPGGTGEIFGVRTNADVATMTYSPTKGSYTGPNHLPLVFTWEKARSCDVWIGRFDATYSGVAPNANFRTGMDVKDDTFGTQTNVHLTAWNAATIRKSALIVTNFSATNADRIEVAWDYINTTTLADGHYGNLTSPRVQVQRVDETGAKLQTAASYPQEYLTVEQIVRDVVGRYMVGAWYTPANNSPYLGHVGSEGIYIDTSATAQITHLTYYDGTTAAEILGDLMTAQPNAYWALWESRYGASVDNNSDARFRFEWATWPSGYTYQATSIDGLEEQPDGGELANFIWLQYPLDSDLHGTQLQAYWDTTLENQLINDARLVRSVVVQASEQMSSATAFTRAAAIHAGYRQTTNAGTLTVRRPIFAYDAGANSGSGMSRMLDPWMIRPGKLIRITDIPPRANGNTFGFGSTAYAPELDGTVFRVVGTTYNSSDNSCVLELDQPPAWDTATQVLESGSGSSNLVVRG